MNELLLINAIFNEVEKAEQKHPEWPKDDIVLQVAIMAEESGEAIKAAIDLHNWHQLPIDGTEPGKHTERTKAHERELIQELLQTAAMCVRIIKNARTVEGTETVIRRIMNPTVLGNMLESVSEAAGKSVLKDIK